MGLQHPVAHVQADGHLVVEPVDHLGAPLGLLQGGGADVDPARAGVQGGGEGLGAANTTRDLDVDVEITGDATNDLGVGPMTEGGVQVDDVQPLRTSTLPCGGDLHRVAEDALGAVHPLSQLHGATVLDVDGGQQDEFFHMPDRTSWCLCAHLLDMPPATSTVEVHHHSEHAQRCFAPATGELHHDI